MTPSTDILKRLRDHCYECQEEAADEIERLRKENEDLKEVVSLQGEVVRMAQRRHEERDEARRLYCKQMADLSRQQDVTEKWWAEEMGWDCFKENTNG